jgi:hypothetical protein
MSAHRSFLRNTSTQIFSGLNAKLSGALVAHARAFHSASPRQRLTPCACIAWRTAVE